LNFSKNENTKNAKKTEKKKTVLEHEKRKCPISFLSNKQISDFEGIIEERKDYLREGA
jgi:hypothetical protein